MENQFISQRKTTQTLKIYENLQNQNLDIRDFFGPIHENDIDEEVYYKKVWQYDNKKKKDDVNYILVSIIQKRKIQEVSLSKISSIARR